MKVKRIVANVETQSPAAAKRFYQDVLGLKPLMDLDWITTPAEDGPPDQLHVRRRIQYADT